MSSPIPWSDLLKDPEGFLNSLPQRLQGRPPQSARPPLDPAGFSTSLDSYTGPWTLSEAAHLLRRTITGPRLEEIREAMAGGMNATVDRLLRDTPLPDAPLNQHFPRDPRVPLGQTWVNRGYQIDPNSPAYRMYRRESMMSWSVDRLKNHEMSFREKMVLFWHNHFVVGGIEDARFYYHYMTTLRSHAMGNFRDLTKAITIDPLMLRYLNGNENSLEAPNENYARELLELFTVGKGPLAGPGDYTTFTEEDVAAMARVLTGWIDRTQYTQNNNEAPRSEFLRRRHESGSKQLSHRFNNTLIENAGEEEYSHLIDVIFQQDVVSTFIVEKLYRWLVYYEISEEVHRDIITPLAQILRDADYEIKPVIDTLLRSEHFYDLRLQGAMIKHPMEYYAGLVNQMPHSSTNDMTELYFLNAAIYQVSLLSQMAYFQAPDVAGWKPFYQSPSYYRLWVNSVTLPYRKSIPAGVILEGAAIGDFILQTDVIAFMEACSAPWDINSMLHEMAHTLHPRALSEEQIAYMKAILIPGLPDFEWSDEYGRWKADPENDDLLIPIQNKLRLVIYVLTDMPEYQLS